MSEPIDRIEWKLWDELQANHYNPNVVFSEELKLLELSIIENGWIQPVLVTREGTIIDGFHRWWLSGHSKKFQAKYAGLLPCAVRAPFTTIRSLSRRGSTSYPTRRLGCRRRIDGRPAEKDGRSRPARSREP